MSVKEAVSQKLHEKFEEYLKTTRSELQALIEKQNSLNQSRLSQESEKIQKIINEKQLIIADLQKHIGDMKLHKKNRSERLYSAFSAAANKKLKKQTLGAWLLFHSTKVSKRKTSQFIESFNKRGLVMRHFKSWKIETMQVHKDNVNIATQKKIQAELSLATSQAVEEVGILRTMLKELTEDLRNETIAKNTLKYKFEQALLRGMSALNMENMTIQQDIISQNRSFTETSRALLFTPEKVGYLTGFR